MTDVVMTDALGADYFVGREAELALLDRACALAAEGRRQLVVVSGEPGIGKTRFCDRAALQAELAGFAVVWGRCWPHGGAPPLWPWPTVLAGLAGDDALAGEDGARPLAGDSGYGEVDPERFARFAAVAAWLTRRLPGTPTMVVIDDLHTADEGTLLLTRFLARALDRLPLVLALVRRAGPAPGGSGADQLLGELERDATVVPLRRFDLAETAAFLAAHGLGDAGLAPTLLRVTGGSPLLLARAVAHGSPAPGLASVEQSIAAAVARLGPAAHRALALLAVLGTTAPAQEIATLAGEPAAAVLEALGEAGRAGLVDPEPAGGYTFTHELVRQAAIDTLAPAQRLDAYARAAALAGAGDTPDQLARRARYALGAAARSDADADIAIDACRAAARAMARGFDYEQAASLLGHVAARTGHRPPSARRAALLGELAEAVLARGRLAAAREAFEDAARAAQAAAEPALLARAALGMGGVWLNERRDTLDRQRVMVLQRAALAGLPEQEGPLRGRLSVRLAAEAVYDGGPVEPVLDALAAVRELGDGPALAEALSLTHHALLTAEHTAGRLTLAEELVRVAPTAGEGMLALLGLMWRTVDLYHLGDPRAERALAEVRERADALGCQSILYVVAAMDVMRLIRAGRLEEAEADAAACWKLGQEVGDADATGYYGAQLVSIRWLQGRDAEVLDLVGDLATSPTLVAAEFAFRASVAAMAARAGRLDDARAAMDRLVPNKLADLPDSSTWLAGMVAIVEAAHLLGDETIAQQARDLLAPFAGLPAMPSLAITCLGPTERAIGLAALTVGDSATAVVHLEHAVEASRRLGNRPVTTLTRAELAEALAARGGKGDLSRAVTLLDQARTEAESMDLAARADAYRERAARLRGERLRDETTPTGRLRRQQGGWALNAGGRETAVPDLLGIRYLAALLERPGDEISALDLCGAGKFDRSHHEVLDARAVEAYRRRLREIDDDLADAHACSDVGRAERLRLEREALAEQIGQSVGLGGRVRAFASSDERARTAVRKAIKRALEAIASVDAGLGAELRGSITTGAACRYAPDPAHPRRWSVDRG